MYEYSYSKFSEQFCCPYFSENVFSKHLRSDVPLDTRHKSNVNKTLMWRPGSRMNVSCSFNIGCWSTGVRPQIGKILED